MLKKTAKMKDSDRANEGPRERKTEEIERQRQKKKEREKK